MQATSDRNLAFGFGTVFLSIILLIALFDPKPTAFSYTIYRIVISLAAAGVGAVIPGFLSVSFKNVLRAGGAVGLFVVVYFFAPVALGVDGPPPPPPPPASSAKEAAEAWLAIVDRRNFSDAYDAMAKDFKARNAKSEMEIVFSRFLTQLGPVRNRDWQGADSAESPPGAPPGQYQGYTYRTKFENEPRYVYEFVFLQAEADKWKVYGYRLGMKNDAGQFVPYDAPPLP